MIPLGWTLQRAQASNRVNQGLCLILSQLLCLKIIALNKKSLLQQLMCGCLSPSVHRALGQGCHLCLLYPAQGVGQHCLHESCPWLPSVVLAAGLGSPAGSTCGIPQAGGVSHELPAGGRALGSALPSPVLWLLGWTLLLGSYMSCQQVGEPWDQPCPHLCSGGSQVALPSTASSEGKGGSLELPPRPQEGALKGCPQS